MFVWLFPNAEGYFFFQPSHFNLGTNRFYKWRRKHMNIDSHNMDLYAGVFHVEIRCQIS